MRIMNGSIEVHESLRQIKMALDLYNHSVSDLGWFSQIVHRDLVKFEMAERKRLRDSLELHLVVIEDVPTIIKHELHLILIGVITQALSEIEHYDKVEDGKQKANKAFEVIRLRTNFKYLVEIVVPRRLKLDILEGQVLTSKACMYLQLGFQCNLVEHFVAQHYNAEDNVASMVEWDFELGEYNLKTTLSSTSASEPLSKNPRVEV